jgi:xanthine dehydrogenase large subunit
MKTIPEASLNLKGETKYVDDLIEARDLLHGAICPTPCSRGRLKGMDASKALALDPSVRFYTAADIPGKNQLGGIVADEPLFAEGEWGYKGQPLALVLASSRPLARRAADLVAIDYEELPPIVDAREAARLGHFVLPSRTMKSGDPEAAFARCATVVCGRVESDGQEHVYLETQGAVAEPREGGGVRVISGTQSPTGVQTAVAGVLGLPMSQVEVEASRLGGAFGGKEDQGSEWAALAALGASLSGLPVKIYLRRRDDMRFTGKRHPYSSDYKIGLDSAGKILAFEVDYYQNSGACCDLSPAILSRSLFHATNAYRVPNVRVTGNMCRTNLLPFTAFRGFGAPQAIFVIEAAIDAASRKAGLDPIEVRRNNLFATGDTTHYGMPLEDCRAKASFDLLLEKCRWAELRKEIAAFNALHRLEKRGAAVMPLCFGVSFTTFFMNQGGALVHVYKDGSVLVSTGAIEMGQQVSRKIARVVSRSLGVGLERIKVGKTSTLTVANTYPTAASTGSDINGMAALAACEEIKKRLLVKAGELLGDPASELSIVEGRVMRNDAPTPLSWDQLVSKTHAARVDLSAHGFYATPGLTFDEESGRGNPFAYHVYGCAAVTATLDVVRGTYKLGDAFLVHDLGDSLDEAVDMGQVEGGFVQGLGWALIEDLRFDSSGRLLADSLSTYKVPDIHFAPERVEIEFIRGANPKAIMGSKAVGEPPLMYGIAGYFAVLDALRAARPEGELEYDLPLTPEKALAFLDGVKA